MSLHLMLADSVVRIKYRLQVFPARKPGSERSAPSQTYQLHTRTTATMILKDDMMISSFHTCSATRLCTPNPAELVHQGLD